MNTVEVVIKLPYKTYRKILSNEYDYGDMNVIIQAGMPLPKGHGKLFDSNVLRDAYQNLGQDFYEAFDFAEANAVIEADKEEGD